jgi:Fibronectin type III domain
VNTGSTASVPAGELVYSAVVTGQPPGGFAACSSQGVPYTTRISADSGSLDESDITSSAAGTQQDTATLSGSTDWYAVTATFRSFPANSSAPTTPTGLSATSVASTRVALQWSASTGSVQGYTVYRNETAIGSTSGTAFLDRGVQPGTGYTYTVAAFNGADQQSGQSSPVQVQTPASSPTFVQGIADSPGSLASPLTLTLSEPMNAGDLLVGWFGQYNAAGQVQVSDNVNGAWTRSVSETFSSETGDIALYYLANSKAAPNGLTVTISASAPAYLQEAIADFSGMATSAPLDQAVVDSGSGATPAGGTTAAVPAGELALAGLITGGQPGTIVPGSSQQVPYVVDVQNGSASADIEDILSTAAGTQTASDILGADSDWYMVVATFRPASG